MDEVTALIFRYLQKIITTVNLQSKGVYTSLSLSSSHLAILKHISVRPGITINELSALTDLRQPTTSALAQKLTNQKLIAKKNSEIDKRKSKLFITKKGKQIMSQAPFLLYEQLEKEINQLPPWQQHLIAGATSKLVELYFLRAKLR